MENVARRRHVESFRIWLVHIFSAHPEVAPVCGCVCVRVCVCVCVCQILFFMADNCGGRGRGWAIGKPLAVTFFDFVEGIGWGVGGG